MSDYEFKLNKLRATANSCFTDKYLTEMFGKGKANKILEKKDLIIESFFKALNKFSANSENDPDSESKWMTEGIINNPNQFEIAFSAILKTFGGVCMHLKFNPDNTSGYREILELVIEAQMSTGLAFSSRGHLFWVENFAYQDVIIRRALLSYKVITDILGYYPYASKIDSTNHRSIIHRNHFIFEILKKILISDSYASTLDSYLLFHNILSKMISQKISHNIEEYNEITIEEFQKSLKTLKDKNIFTPREFFIEIAWVKPPESLTNSNKFTKLIDYVISSTNPFQLILQIISSLQNRTMGLDTILVCEDIKIESMIYIKIIKESFELYKSLNKSKDISQLLKELENISHHSNESEDISHFSNESDDISHFSNESEDISHLSNESEDISHLSNKPEDVSHLSNDIFKNVKMSLKSLAQDNVPVFLALNALSDCNLYDLVFTPDEQSTIYNLILSHPNPFLCAKMLVEIIRSNNFEKLSISISTFTFFDKTVSNLDKLLLLYVKALYKDNEGSNFPLHFGIIKSFDEFYRKLKQRMDDRILKSNNVLTDEIKNSATYRTFEALECFAKQYQPLVLAPKR